jgi:predicted DNA-binding protein
MKRDSEIHVRIPLDLKNKLKDFSKGTILTMSDIINLVMEDWVNDRGRVDQLGERIKNSFRKS